MRAVVVKKYPHGDRVESKDKGLVPPRKMNLRNFFEYTAESVYGMVEGAIDHVAGVGQRRRQLAVEIGIVRFRLPVSETVMLGTTSSVRSYLIPSSPVILPMLSLGESSP